MKQPKVDNKWVDKKIEQFRDSMGNINIIDKFVFEQKQRNATVSLDLNKVKFRNFLRKFITQTKQDTLDEVEKLLPYGASFTDRFYKLKKHLEK